MAAKPAAFTEYEPIEAHIECGRKRHDWASARRAVKFGLPFPISPQGDAGRSGGLRLGDTQRQTRPRINQCRMTFSKVPSS